MRKYICLILWLLAVSGFAQESTVATASGGAYTITAGSLAAIRVALTNVGAGGKVRALAGHYFISNNLPVVIPTGVTLEGAGPGVIFEVDTNGGQGGRLDYSTFQAFDNSTIRNITWLATNGWNTTTTIGAYASFLRSGPTYTNVLVDSCDLQGGSDVFYATNGAGQSQTIVLHSKLTSLWDFSSGGAGTIISVGSSWTGLGGVSRPSRIVLSEIKLLDYGSTFTGFAGFDTAGSGGPWGFHGTVFNFSPSEANIFNSTRTDLTGDYVDTVKGLSYSLTAERASYITNGFTTNITYSMTLTNMKVTSTGGDANKTGTYLLGTTDGDFASGQSFWTNQSHPTVVLWLNDPAGVSLEGGNNTFTIRTNSGAGVIVAVGQWSSFANLLNSTAVAESTVTAAQPFSLADGDQTATIAESTNSITTNAAPNLQPSIFQGQFSYNSNANFVLQKPLIGPGVTWNTNFTAYAAGTAYTLTGSSAALDFGTTDPVMTINQAGTYKITGKVGIKYSGATYVGAQTITLKFRRTNNTAADLANGSRAVELPVLTTFTGGDVMPLPDITYTATSGDTLTIFGILSATPSAGSVQADSAELMAERLY